jgi:hypothetical protein
VGSEYGGVGFWIGAVAAQDFVSRKLEGWWLESLALPFLFVVTWDRETNKQTKCKEFCRYS